MITKRYAPILLILSTLVRIRPAYSLSSVPSTSATKSASIESSSRPTIFPNSTPVQPSDVATLMRQTGQVNPSRAAIGVPSNCACQHGFPQAFAMDPLYGGRINSGLLKLTCPHLVRAVDALEDEGLITALSRRLADDKLLQTEVGQTHNRHSKVRQAMMSSSELEIVRSKLGKSGSDAFGNAGVAGASPGSTDLKCLHAWLTDALFSDTRLGEILRQELEERGVDVAGTASCHLQCDPHASIALADPPKPRNKQRLRTSKEVERRKRRKKELKSLAL